jgi:hypothetical protein
MRARSVVKSDRVEDDSTAARIKDDSASRIVETGADDDNDDDIN